MNTKDHQARAFALAVATIRSDAETLDDAPLYCDIADRKTYRYVDHLPRKEYRLPAPGNPRGMIVSAPAARDSLNALADRLEKGARAFGGTPPKRDRSPLNTRGIVAARNAHAEGHHNAAHRALGGRLYIDMYGTPHAVVSQMQAGGHDILLCRSIAARSNDIRAIHAASGAFFATNKQNAEFNDFCAWLTARAEACSEDLAVMPSISQPDALAAYLAGDTVEIIDPDAEPCDTAAAVARAEASAAPEPEPEHVRAECRGNKEKSRLIDGVDAYHYVAGQLGMTSTGSFTRNMARWITFDRADVERMGDTIRPYGATKNGVFIPATKPEVDAKSTIAHVASAKPEPEPVPSTPRQQLGRGEGQRDPGTLYGWHIVTDTDGVRYMVLHARHHTVVAVPLVEGRRPEVSRSGPDVVRFNLRPGDTLETGERAGPLFDTGKVYDLNTLRAKPEPEPEPGDGAIPDIPAKSVKPRARLFQSSARMVVPRGQIRAAKVKVKMPGAPPEDETRAASRSRPWAGETSRRRQSRCCTMRRRKALRLPLRRSMPLRTRRRCARRRHAPPHNARADDAPHLLFLVLDPLGNIPVFEPGGPTTTRPDAIGIGSRGIVKFQLINTILTTHSHL